MTGRQFVLVPAALILAALAAPSLYAQSGDGEAVFSRACASCHDGAPTSRAPNRDALRARSPQAVIDALLTGTMRMQGARLSGDERRAVAEFVTGKPLAVAVVDPAAGRCSSSAPFSGLGSMPAWNGWSPTETNTHAQTAAAAGLSAADVPRLKLKWALGFPDASVAFSQPTVVGGRVFVGSHNGTVYSLDAKTGCVHWTYSAKSGVRSAMMVGPRASGRDYAVYFGDLAGNVYALNAESGATFWLTKVDTHPFARITGSPMLYRDRLYVPVSSLEESMAANPDYGCCTFRGSLVALAAETGATIWQTYTIPKAEPRGKNPRGHVLHGPSGGPIWTTPTIDAKRNRIYVATGNMYSGPQQLTSDAVLAFDLDDGRIVWTRQMTARDIFPCGRNNPNCRDEDSGDDFDFGNSPIIAPLPDGRDLIVIGQKSGIGWAIDPDKEGAVVWEYRAGQGGALGGIEWGSSVDSEHAYFPVSDIQRERPGGLHAVRLATGERVWYAAPRPPLCGQGRNCNAAQSAAITVIPGVVFSGANDGGLRAYSTRDGSVIWEFDTNRSFETVNRVAARGASIIGPGPTVVGGMLYTNSGYGQYGGRPGNVLLAFGLE